MSGIKIKLEGAKELAKKVANLRDLKKQKSLLLSIYSQSATPVLKTYKNAMIELNDRINPAKTKPRNFASNKTDGNRIPAGALRDSIKKIRSKSSAQPAIYVGPRTNKMRAKAAGFDGYYLQFLVFGTKDMGPKINLSSRLKKHEAEVKIRISKKLKEKIEKAWGK